MKNLLVVGVFCLSRMVFSAQVPSYFENDPEWRMDLEYQVGPDCFLNEEVQIFIAGDTLMTDGHWYKELRSSVNYNHTGFWKTEDCSGSGYVEQLYHYLRQSGDSIFKWGNPEALPFIHYNFNVGDTIHGASIYTLSENLTSIVTSIDSIETFSGWFRRFQLDSNPWGPEYLIEGIGHAFGFAESMEIGVNGTSQLVCYRQNGITQFETGEGDCTIVAPSVDELSKVKFQLFPNPVKDILQIRRTGSVVSSDSFQVTIHSLDGRQMSQADYRVHSGSSIDIDLSTFESGIYIVGLASKAGNFTHLVVRD